MEKKLGPPQKRVRVGEALEHRIDTSRKDAPCAPDGDMRNLETELPVPLPPMINQIDWREVLCQFLSVSSRTDDNAVLASLKSMTDRIKAAERSAHMKKDHDSTGEYQIIHRIRCAKQSTEELCLNVPWTVKTNSKTIHLRGSDMIEHLELHLERYKAVSFIVYKDYKCCRTDSAVIRADASDLLVNESVCIVSEAFCLALTELWSKAFGNASHPKFEQFSEFTAPFVWWYCQKGHIDAAITLLQQHQQQHLRLFQTYINASLGEEYATVDLLMAKGKTTAEYMTYLYYLRAFVATSWLMQASDGNITKAAARIKNACGSQRYVHGSSWSFDGLFQQNAEPWLVDCRFSWEESFDIQELDVYPIRFADHEVSEALRDRGKMFWECRLQNYVCYRRDAATRVQSPSDARYMIDINTYTEMHPPPESVVPNRDDLGPEATMQGNPPPGEDDFILCLPSTIPGYHMQKKDWITLHVNRMSAVQWNVDAFKMLVVEEQKKELIRALVTNRIAAGEGTDLMSGKGNGLFILLHGGPGTGKTLTTESVAEIAQKPLYRVTCGDVGTNAEDVEKYLETVLMLGKTWGCVVLLDEADVFLMQRSVEDFRRNALVSVFLRVLEYYDGILILTSNRVGTFDAAFKSRIQLSLRYPKLQEDDRFQIWTNFIEHIEGLTNSRTTSLGINSAEIKKNLRKLAKEELNGREIRNAVSTARQLAMFRKERMGYAHLRIAIDEKKKFEEYAVDLNGGFTDDEVAKINREY
ncbi:related to TOB3 (member of AAA-ATPase family) [Phialocephala subalpina]|uniref:Related to TOB3 (Member of AAA-ATPase family) n=1 Tax=Phialocephala subalpina TaxID=576137 RepID=A0A1L7WF29_9HELO|nr:related to TOB3 (member of AAA-ATPase family) [Phialocephala subalpina]